MKLLICLIVLLLAQIISSKTTDQSAYIVWNSDSSTSNIGTIDLNKLNVVTEVELPDTQIVGGARSSYNTKTNQIMVLVQNTNSSESGLNTIYTIQIETWKVWPYIYSLPNSIFNVTSIIFDQTDDAYNIFATYSVVGRPGIFVVAKLSVQTTSYRNKQVLNGTYVTSTYNWKDEVFIVTFTNSSGLFVNEYTQLGLFKSSTLYTISNLETDFVSTSLPYNMIYDPRNGVVVSNVNLLNSADSGLIIEGPELFYLDTKNSQFYSSQLMTSSNTLTTTFAVNAIAFSPSESVIFIVANATNELYTGNTIESLNTQDFISSPSSVDIDIINIWTF